MRFAIWTVILALSLNAGVLPAVAQVDPGSVRGLRPGLYYYFKPGEIKASVHYVPNPSSSVTDPFAKPVKPLPVRALLNFPTLSYQELQEMTLPELQSIAAERQPVEISAPPDRTYIPPAPQQYQAVSPPVAPVPTMGQQENMLDALEGSAWPPKPAPQQPPPQQRPAAVYRPPSPPPAPPPQYSSPFQQSGANPGYVGGTAVRGAPLQQGQHVTQLLEKGMKAIQGKRYKEAIKILEPAAAYDPNINSATLHINLGAAHEKLDEDEVAVQEFNKALQFSPSDADAMWGLATSLKKTGRYDEAVAEYQRVMQYSKRRDDVRDSMVEIGGCYQSMGRVQDAVTWLERYCQTTPRPSDVDQVQKIIAELREAGTKESFSNPSGADYAESMGQKEKQVWEKSNLPLRVYIASGTGVKGFRKPFTGMMTDALTAWCQASNQKITWFQVEDESQANVVIRWSADMKGAPGQGGEGGLCEKFGDSDGQTMIIGKAILTMRTLGLDGKEVPDIEMRAVCLHETGHALGLGHSANNKDVMFFSETSEHKLALTPRDKATIARLYADYPVLSLNGNQ